MLNLNCYEYRETFGTVKPVEQVTYEIDNNSSDMFTIYKSVLFPRVKKPVHVTIHNPIHNPIIFHFKTMKDGFKFGHRYLRLDYWRRRDFFHEHAKINGV